MQSDKVREMQLEYRARGGEKWRLHPARYRSARERNRMLEARNRVDQFCEWRVAQR